MPLPLQIKLLNGFQVAHDDRPISGLSTSRSQALFAYLVLHRQTPQPRQRIAFHLWADSTDAQARSNLRKELSYLRRDLPEADQFLRVDAKTLQWSTTAPFTLDVAEFEEAVKAAGQATHPTEARLHLEQAMQLYRGDLLPNCEDEWIVSERERLQQMRVRVLEHLIDVLKTQQDYRTAIDYAQQLLRIDPLNEATYASLMRLHGLSGDRATALQIYHRCMKMLCDELGVDPSATTRKLYEQLLLDDESSTSSTARSRASIPIPGSALPMPDLPPLVGREPEWALIQQWIEVNNNAANVLLLVGEPGIGKTRLLEELRVTLQNRGQAQVLWGRGFAAEMVRPYGIWIDALRSASADISSRSLPGTVNVPAELGSLLPEVLPVGLSLEGQAPSVLPDRSHLFDAVVQLLAQCAAQSPLVVILDDVQWIDEASSALLHYAIRLLGQSSVLFACTARSQELEANATVMRVMQALRREQRLQRLDLRPLDRDQTATLICQTSAGASPIPLELADRVFVDSGGNPLFVLELSRALAQNQSTHANNLEALIGDRLQQLDETARELLPWAAALGRNFKPTTIAQVADYPLPKLLTAIEHLERQTIICPSVVGDDVGYDFVHDIVRQVAYRQLSEPRRCLVHWQIAHKLQQVNPSDQSLAGDIAHHAALGGDCALAASASLAAAERGLKVFAYAEATILAQRGIQYCQSLDNCDRIRLQLGLLRVCALAGVTGDRAAQLEAEVQQLLTEARVLGLTDEAIIGIETLGILHFDHSNFTHLHQCSLQGVELSRSASPAVAARILSHSGACMAEIGCDMIRAEAVLQEARSLAARVGLELCDVYSGLGAIQTHQGHYAEARTLFQQALQVAQLEQDHWREYTYLSYLAMLELEVHNPTAALLYCHEMAIVSAKMQGEGSEGAFATALKALTHYQQHSHKPQTNVQLAVVNTELERSIAALQRLDAKRKLSYVLTSAAELDLEGDRPQLAADRAALALTAAQTIQHPSEIALAWGFSIQAMLALGDRPRAMIVFESLQDKIDRYTLSDRACNVVNRVTQSLQPVSSSR